jgi:ribose 5-phosphate isomerase B
MLHLSENLLTMEQKLPEIVIGSDHAGFKMKEYIKQSLIVKGYFCKDFGTFSEESCDYPDIAHPLSEAVQLNQFQFGILLCGSGNGMAIVANKYKSIRAAICWNKETTKLARLHNDANILILPARFIGLEDAVNFSFLFLTTSFEGGRHQRRVDKITNSI